MLDNQNNCARQAANTGAHKMEAANELTPQASKRAKESIEEMEVETW